MPECSASELHYKSPLSLFPAREDHKYGKSELGNKQCLLYMLQYREGRREGGSFPCPIAAAHEQPGTNTSKQFWEVKLQ